MKATAKLLVAAVAAGGVLLAADAQSQDRNPAGRAARGAAPAAVPRSADGPSGNAAGVDHGGRGWSRGDGRHGSWGHGRWAGHRHYWGGYRHWAPHWSFYFGVPILWGSYYWGAPYWYDYPGTVVYREVERDGPYSERPLGPATTEVPRGEGMPRQGPLYMNYCESAKAYFPKVTSCPEGWKLATPTS